MVDLDKIEQGTSIVLQNVEVFRNDGFVDMDETKFVWARAFPSCYMPSYIYIYIYLYIYMNREIQWVITNNMTGFNGPREKW